MSAIAAPAPAPVSGSGIAGAGRFVRDTALLTVRSLRAVPRVPERLLDVTIQPIVFILLFLYVFGSAIHVPGVSYKDYLFPGIIGQSLAFGIIGAGVATSHDMTEGVIDRFRSLPISRLSIISAQVMGQFCEQVLGMTIVVVFGLILGWNPQLSAAHAVELVALMVLAMLAFTWMGVLLGMLVRSPDAMQGVGFIVIFPLAFLAGTFVPIAGMDAVPRAIAHWDPISALVATVRGLTEGVPLERLVAARPSRGGDGPVVPRDHRGLRAARVAALQPHARRLRLLSPAGGLGVAYGLGSSSELVSVSSQAPARRRSRSSRGGARSIVEQFAVASLPPAGRPRSARSASIARFTAAGGQLCEHRDACPHVRRPGMPRRVARRRRRSRPCSRAEIGTGVSRDDRRARRLELALPMTAAAPVAPTGSASGTRADTRWSARTAPPPRGSR